MYGDKGTVITDEPIFDIYLSEQEFVLGEDKEVVVTDKPIFFMYII